MFINLVFESGGIKGLTYVGALKYFEERGFKVFSASGSSVGAIFASLVVSGYKAHEIESLIEEFNINELLIPNTFKNGLKTKGIYNISGLEEKLEKALLKKGVGTFLDVKHGDDYLLKIVVTDAKTKKMVVLPDDLNLYGFSKDNFKIAKAVVMSCSIPFVYSKYRCDKYNFVDGGTTNRFPVDLINNEKYETYGLKLSNSSFLIEKIIKLIYKNKTNQSFENLNHIINIEIPDIKAIQFNKGLNQKKELYRAGYISCKRYFAK